METVSSTQSVAKEFYLGEEMINKGIETIEFVLGNYLTKGSNIYYTSNHPILYFHHRKTLEPPISN